MLPPDWELEKMLYDNATSEETYSDAQTLPERMQRYIKEWARQASTKVYPCGFVFCVLVFSWFP